MSDLLKAVWSALNTPVGIVAVAVVVLYLLNRVYAKKPLWQKFEGTIIAAVKWAEKAIPDDTPNPAAAKFDEALRWAVKVFEEVQRRRPNAKETAELKEGINIIHADLEKNGQL